MLVVACSKQTPVKLHRHREKQPSLKEHQLCKRRGQVGGGKDCVVSAQGQLSERAMLCFLPSRSLDRKPQRPLLGKSRTLPSIPQSPVLSRLPLLDPTAYREEMPEQKPYKKRSASDHQKGCTVPSTGESCRAGASSCPSVLGGLQNPSPGTQSTE